MRLATGSFPDVDGPITLAHLDVKSSRIVRDAPFIARLAGLLRDGAWSASSYMYEIAAMADVAFRFEAGPRKLEVLACLRCRTAAAIAWEGGEWVFELEGPALLDIALEAFPEDRALLWVRAEAASMKTPSELLGPAQAILAGATSGEALGVKGPGRVNEIAELEVTSTHPMDAALVSRLALALADPATYTQSHTRCGFIPNVAFRIHKGPETAEVIVCFGCNQMRINAQDGSGAPVHLAGSDLRAGEPLWEIAAAAIGRAELERIYKEARH